MCFRNHQPGKCGWDLRKKKGNNKGKHEEDKKKYRLNIAMSAREYDIICKEALRRNVSTSELIRMATLAFIGDAQQHREAVLREFIQYVNGVPRD